MYHKAVYEGAQWQICDTRILRVFMGQNETWETVNEEMLQCLRKLDDTKDSYVYCFHGKYIIATIQCMHAQLWVVDIITLKIYISIPE